MHLLKFWTKFRPLTQYVFKNNVKVRCMAVLCRPSPSFTLRPTRPILISSKNQGVRTLFSSQDLGIENFGKTIEFIKSELGQGLYNESTIHNAECIENLENDFSVNFVKKLVCETYEDKDKLNLLLQYLEKHKSQIAMQQQEDKDNNTYLYGVTIIRLLYISHCTDIAMKLLVDEGYSKFFQQRSAYLIVMQLLYNDQRYNDVIALYKYMLKKNYLLNISHTVLVCGACYKLSTEDSLQEAIKLLNFLRNQCFRINKRSIGFVAFLALQLDKPEVAIKVIRTFIRMMSGFIPSNVLILAHAKLGNFKEVVQMICSAVPQVSDPLILKFAPKSFTFSIYVLDEVEEMMKKNSDPSLLKQFQEAKEQLEEKQLLQMETLEHRLFNEGKLQGSKMRSELLYDRL